MKRSLSATLEILVIASSFRITSYATFFDTDEIVKMRNNTILNRFENYISFFHPVFTFWSHHTSQRLRAQASIRLKEQWEFERVWEVYEYGAQHNKSTSQTMLFIFQSFLYSLRTHKSTHARTLAHRSQEGSRKSIREPSPFTFISHLFLIPPPFWSFLFPLSLAQLLFYQLGVCVWSIFPINQWTVSGRVWKT